MRRREFLKFVGAGIGELTVGMGVTSLQKEEEAIAESPVQKIILKDGLEMVRIEASFAEHSVWNYEEKFPTIVSFITTKDQVLNLRIGDTVIVCFWSTNDSNKFQIISITEIKR